MRSSPFARLDQRLAPAPAAARIAFLKERAFAHRGLHGPDTPENSSAAFRAAVAQGWGIELDVRLSRDGEAFVFHDEEFDRLTGERGPIGQRPAREIAAIRLSGNDERIPRLTDVLGLVAGRVPLLIEVKTAAGHAAAAAIAVRRALEGYRGPVAVMSFDPEVSRWLARHAPRIVRGLIVSEGGRRRRTLLRRRLALWRAKPDFLAYDVRDLPSPFAEAARHRGLPVLSWTVRGVDPARDRIAGADQIIFEMAAA